jgi:hypothetical protein
MEFTMEKNIDEEIKRITSNPLSARLLKRIIFDTQYGMSVNFDTEATPFAARLNQIKPLLGWTGITNRYGQMVCKKLPPSTILTYYHIMDSVNKNHLKKTMRGQSILSAWFGLDEFDTRIRSLVMTPSKTASFDSVIHSGYISIEVEVPAKDSIKGIYLCSYKYTNTFYPKIDLSDLKVTHALLFNGYCDWFPPIPIQYTRYAENKDMFGKEKPDEKFVKKYINRRKSK